MTLFEWLFRNRRTGEITIWQSPNAPALVSFVAGAVAWLFPDGAVGRVARAVTAGATLVWAVLELASGVNPNRRLTGLGALLSLGRRALR